MELATYLNVELIFTISQKFAQGEDVSKVLEVTPIDSIMKKEEKRCRQLMKRRSKYSNFNLKLTGRLVHSKQSTSSTRVCQNLKIASYRSTICPQVVDHLAAGRSFTPKRSTSCSPPKLENTLGSFQSTCSFYVYFKWS